jgi:hypothetical protein
LLFTPLPIGGNPNTVRNSKELGCATRFAPSTRLSLWFEVRLKETVRNTPCGTITSAHILKAVRKLAVLSASLSPIAPNSVTLQRLRVKMVVESSERYAQLQKQFTVFKQFTLLEYECPRFVPGVVALNQGICPRHRSLPWPAALETKRRYRRLCHGSRSDRQGKTSPFS